MIACEHLFLMMISLILSCFFLAPTLQEVSPVQTYVGSDANFSFMLTVNPNESFVYIKDKAGAFVMVARGNVGESKDPLYKDRVNFTGNTNQKLISFILRYVTLEDAGIYTALLEDNLSKIGSQMLIVKAAPSKPQIVEVTGHAVNGTNYHLNCSAQSSSQPPNHNLSMFSEWRRDDMLINSGRYIVNGTELTITGISYKQDNGSTLTCVAFEDHFLKSGNSDKFIMDVKYGPDNIQLSPFNSSITERENGKIVVNCTADCNPPCSFKWTKDMVTTPLSNNQTLIINDVSKSDTGRYLCNVSNSINGISLTASIHVMIIYGPVSAQISPSEFPLKVEEHTTLNITCSADCFPDCTFTWNGPPNFFQMGAQLSRIVDRDKEGNYTCTATNQRNLDKKATVSVMVIVLYGPGNSVNLGSIPPTLGVDLHQTAPDITCNATCNPPCDYRWYQNGTFFRIGATLSLGIVEKTAKGNYRCEAYTSVLGVNRSSSTSVNITVYFGAGIVNLSVNDNNTVNENSSAIFQCHVDSNPPSTITWTKESNNAVLQTESGVVQSKYRIETAECLNMDNYTCSAYNGIWTPAKATIPLFVRCHPRTDYRLSHETKVYRKRYEAAVLRYTVISYPLPTFNWTFLGNGSESRNLPFFASQHNNGLQSELWFSGLGINDFGNYSVIADNSLPPSAREIFEIIPADVPEVPSNVMILEITQTSVKVQWMAGNNGGLRQIFHVVVTAGSLIHNVTADDPGYRENGTVVLEGLLPKTKYSIYVIASNSYGSSNMTETINITTLEVITLDSSRGTFPLPAVAGGIGAGVFFLLAVVALFIWRRYHHSQHTDDINEDEKERPRSVSGLVENPVYDSSRPIPGQSVNNGATGDEYAEVVKPNKKLLQVDDRSNIYAQVDKTTKNVKKGAEKGKHGKTSRGDIYENADLVRKRSTPDNLYQNSSNAKAEPCDENFYEDAGVTASHGPQKNKDSLLYADLMLHQPSRKNGKVVIRGIENRTEYAEIAYGKKGEPLPENDHEKENSEANHVEQ